MISQEEADKFPLVVKNLRALMHAEFVIKGQQAGKGITHLTWTFADEESVAVEFEIVLKAIQAQKAVHSRWLFDRGYDYSEMADHEIRRRRNDDARHDYLRGGRDETEEAFEAFNQSQRARESGGPA